MTIEGLIIWLVIGAIAGWLAGLIMEGYGFGLIGNIVVGTHNGIPTYVHDIGNVIIDHAPRLGQFGFMKDNDAVEGVILMRVGEQAQVILKKVEELTATLNRSVLPPVARFIKCDCRRGRVTLSAGRSDTMAAPAIARLPA